MSAKSHFKVAQRRVAIAKAERATVLYLPDLQDLTELPDDVRALTTLTTLNLMETKVTDLSPIKDLIALTDLYLTAVQVIDLTPIKGLTALKVLYLGDTPVSDLTPLMGLTALTDLNLMSTHVTDLTPIKGLTALTELDLMSTQVTDLTPISGLTALKSLDLMSTQVTDLTTIKGLMALTRLDLRDSSAFDLRPLRSLQRLANGEGVFKVDESYFGGLSFSNSAATRADPRIAEIAEIADPAERARELFAYLENWVPPVPADSPLAPSFIVPEQGPITSVPDRPEGGDAEQEELRGDLVRKASDLVECIGSSNDLAILRGAAEHYQAQVRKDLPSIRLNLLYSAANSLRVAYEADRAAIAQDRYSEQLPPKAAAALSDLVETHALFFMGFPNAADVHRRMLEGLTGGRNTKIVDLAEPIVNAFQGKATVLDPENAAALADDLAGSKGEGPSAEIAEKRLGGTIQNIIFAVARKAWAVSKSTMKKVIEHDVIAFFLGNSTAIGAFLRTALGVSEGWIAFFLQQALRWFS